MDLLRAWQGALGVAVWGRTGTAAAVHRHRDACCCKLTHRTSPPTTYRFPTAPRHPFRPPPQIQNECTRFGASSRIKSTCVYGGAPKGPQAK